MLPVRPPPNFGPVHGVAGVYRSSTPKILPLADRARLVETLGLRTVICAAAEIPRLEWPPEILSVRLPIYKPFLTRGQWRIWRALLAAAERRPMLVHCQVGAERTGILCAHAQIVAGVDPRRVKMDLDRFGEGFWLRGRGHGEDRDTLWASLDALRRTGDVLPDAVVESMLRGCGKSLVGGDVEATIAVLLGGQTTSEPRWRHELQLEEAFRRGRR